MKNNLFWKTIEGLLPMPKAAQLLGWKLLKHEQHTREIFVEFDASASLTNPVGKIQGGMLTAMLDDCMGPAIYASLEKNEIAITTKMATFFQRPALPGQIKGFGKLYRRRGNICYTKGLLQDCKGRTLATATACYKIIDLSAHHSTDAE
ncbi:PaaI family thioesterase [Pseudomonas sp. S37]|uniref:PaaI family thioesterase n=1 Tax=Pseudomonas sp. S37 TaxID=2767449 RepID=UPI001914248B|nr:PaaI family thioesterase [Pseudomonas sp. S37]MBK4996088.1 PaaI family thioesterase [Pseudomonas sp. S37]